MSEVLLKIEDLHVSVGEKEILKGVDLTVNRGEIHALMGPNGSGKSTLSNAVMGHPNYTITSGKVWYKGEDITEMATDEKA
ncbi:MAG TPA: ATP-binding cassette domain-containing protein, partial [bacterium]|nr:ATP-binding cassette domain-containing protein [bacterium]